MCKQFPRPQCPHASCRLRPLHFWVEKALIIITLLLLTGTAAAKAMAWSVGRHEASLRLPTVRPLRKEDHR